MNYRQDGTVATTLLVGKGCIPGNIDGSFTVALFNSVHAITSLYPTIYLVIDQSKKAMRLIDMTSQSVRTVDISELSGGSLSSLLVMDGSIYIGHLGGITKITG